MHQDACTSGERQYTLAFSFSKWVEMEICFTTISREKERVNFIVVSTKQFIIFHSTLLITASSELTAEPNIP
jgi:hypothetical protein